VVKFGYHPTNHQLLDRGYASAAQIGVYTPDGEWLIEGHGVEPDMVVDNLPHATYWVTTPNLMQRFIICKNRFDKNQ